MLAPLQCSRSSDVLGQYAISETTTIVYLDKSTSWRDEIKCSLRLLACSRDIFSSGRSTYAFRRRDDGTTDGRATDQKNSNTTII